MLEARLNQVAVMPENGKLVFCGVVDYYDEAMNLKSVLRFDPDGTFQAGQFLDDLRESIAEGFDIPPYRVSIEDQVVIGKIMVWKERFEKLGLI